ncbi:Hpt domain-containing protein [Vibrio penaeicida]|uniref:Hpt domain-containing protein n=1 Tax=Vibrio penaeicida TaxID=104609 RepID=UPI000CE9BE5F|nr:Hpt domain-containing protein [Vibrio penaeicida]
MDESSKKNIKFVIFSVLLIWGVISTVFYIQFSQLRQEAESVDSLSSQIEEFRYTLSFPDPIRAQHIEQMSLSLELVKSVAVQIESGTNAGFWSPETAQLVYLTDRFVERAENYLNVAMDIRGLSEQILKAKSSEGVPSGLVVLYNELGAYMFNSFYANTNLNPPNFMTLESIMLRSEQFDAPYKKQIQSLLSQSSIILAEHAQLSYVTEEIIKHSIVREIDEVKFGFKESEKRIFTLTLFLSGVLIFALSWFVYSGVSQTTRIGAIGAKVPNPSKGDEAKSHSKNSAKVQEDSSSTQTVTKEMDSAPLVQSEIPQHSDFQSAHSQNTSSHASFVLPADSESPTSAEESVNIPNTALPSGFDPDTMLETFDQDEESVLMVLNVFLQDHGDDVNKLKEALAKEKEQAHRIAHSLKGVAGNLGATSLRDICAEIENVLKDGAFPSEQSISELERCLKLTVDDVESYLGAVNTA